MGIKMKLEEKNSILLACGSYLFGLGILFVSYFFPIISRIGWYFTMQECVYMGILARINRKQYRYIFIICGLGVLGMEFVLAMTRNSQGTMPYIFFWQ